MCHVSHDDPSASRPRLGDTAEALPHTSASTAALFTVDGAGRVTAWSEQATALFDRAAPEVLGLAWDVLFDADAATRLKEILISAGQGRPCPDVVQLRSSAGRSVRLQV